MRLRRQEVELPPDLAVLISGQVEGRLPEPLATRRTALLMADALGHLNVIDDFLADSDEDPQTEDETEDEMPVAAQAEEVFTARVERQTPWVVHSF